MLGLSGWVSASYCHLFWYRWHWHSLAAAASAGMSCCVAKMMMTHQTMTTKSTVISVKPKWTGTSSQSTGKASNTKGRKSTNFRTPYFIRVMCAGFNAEYLRLRPVMFPDVACLKCNGVNPMKLWPKDRIRKFRCSRITEDCEAREDYESSSGDEDVERARLKLEKVNLTHQMFIYLFPSLLSAFPWWI